MSGIYFFRMRGTERYSLYHLKIVASRSSGFSSMVKEIIVMKHIIRKIPFFDCDMTTDRAAYKTLLILLSLHKAIPIIEK